MKVLNLFSISYFAVQCIQCQYVSFQNKGPTKNNMCEGGSNTSLIEHFFNLIFSEFHNHPPVCVCVQMCVEQPTYCYPNGCFKKVEPVDNKKRHAATAQVSQLQRDAAKPMSFLVDSQSDFIDNLLTMKPVPDNKPVKHDHNSFNELFRDPFKERYQSIFKYKKSPKVHLKYNLREQVKHKKTDLIKIEKIDVSKTKWPVSESKQYYTEKQKKIHKDSGNRYFHSDLESGPSYPNKFFKRDLTKKFPAKEHNFDEVENTTEATFSLENLIENLIESSFGPLTNDTELDLSVNLDYSIISNATTIEPIISPYKRSLFGNKSMLIINETTNVVSMNNTNENLDENKYHDDSKGQMYNNVFNDMIASLSKHIEKNNNSSIEMMEQVLGHRVKDAPNFVKSSEDSVPTPELPFMDDIRIKTSTNNIETSARQEENSSTTTTEVTTEESTEPELIEKQEVLEATEKEGVSVTKKGHQVLTRKLHNSKPN